MRPLDPGFVRSVLLPANLIVAALLVFGVLAWSVEGDLRRASAAIDPDLPRAAAAGPAAAAEAGKRGTLTVKVSRARNAAGKVLVLVFARGPLTDGANIVARMGVTASPQGSSAVFGDLPYGPYAVLAIHDENGNGNLDRQGAGGPPAEGIGNSGPAAPLQGPPTYEDSRIVLDREAMEVEIPLSYH